MKEVGNDTISRMLFPGSCNQAVILGLKFVITLATRNEGFSSIPVPHIQSLVETANEYVCVVLVYSFAPRESSVCAGSGSSMHVVVFRLAFLISTDQVQSGFSDTIICNTTVIHWLAPTKPTPTTSTDALSSEAIPIIDNHLNDYSSGNR